MKTDFVCIRVSYKYIVPNTESGINAGKRALVEDMENASRAIIYNGLIVEAAPEGTTAADVNDWLLEESEAT